MTDKQYINLSAVHINSYKSKNMDIVMSYIFMAYSVE